MSKTHSGRKNYKLAHLEQAWNSNVGVNQEPKRYSQMSNDIKTFINRSMSTEADPFQKHSLNLKRPQPSGDLFGTISSAFKFQHHEGTDSSAELKIIKVILVREGLLMSLRYLTDKTKKSDNIDKSCTRILELLAQVRESSLNYLEALCLWRQTAQDPEAPRVFHWERKNYTMKVISDLDFLSDNAVIVSTLGIPQSQFRSNPLMLTNNLEDSSTWMDPLERAASDCGGVREGAQFESRLRLRFAERILLQEVELTGSDAVPGEESYSEGSQHQQQVFITQQNNNSFSLPPVVDADYRRLPPPNHNKVPPPKSYSSSSNAGLVKGSSALEDDDDEDERYGGQGGTDGGNSLSARNSTWEGDNLGGLYGLPTQGVARARSANSASSMRVAGGPDSRSSTISYGFSSAPSSSHGGAASRGAVDSNRSNNRLYNSGTAPLLPPAAASFEFGHDFFSGNWSSDAQPKTHGKHLLQDSSSAGDTEPSDVFFRDGGLAPVPTNDFHVRSGYHYGAAGQQNYSADQQSAALDDHGIDDDALFSPSVHHHHSLSSPSGLDGHSAVSGRSVGSVGDEDLRLLLGIPAPPKELVLAGSACIILLSAGSKVPTDVSWGAFWRLAEVVDISTAMRQLDSANISKFKLVALLPFLQMLTADSALDRIQQTGLPYAQFVACSRLVEWVKQFTASGLKKLARQQQQGQPASKTSASPQKRSPSKNSSGAGSSRGSRQRPDVSSSSKIVLHPLKVDTAGGPGRQRIAPLKSSGAGSVGGGRTDSSTAFSAKKPTIPGSIRGKRQPSIPKVSLELAPCHTEVLPEGRYKNSLLLVLLATPETVALSMDKSDNPEVSSGERLAVKVYDIAESREAVAAINLREMALLQNELTGRYGEWARVLFEPERLAWWVRNIRSLIVVTSARGGGLKLTISRKLIEDMVSPGTCSTPAVQAPARKTPAPPAPQASTVPPVTKKAPSLSPKSATAATPPPEIEKRSPTTGESSASAGIILPGVTGELPSPALSPQAAGDDQLTGVPTGASREETSASPGAHQLTSTTSSDEGDLGVPPTVAPSISAPAESISPVEVSAGGPAEVTVAGSQRASGDLCETATVVSQEPRAAVTTDAALVSVAATVPGAGESNPQNADVAVTAVVLPEVPEASPSEVGEATPTQGEVKRPGSTAAVADPEAKRETQEEDCASALVHPVAAGDAGEVAVPETPPSTEAMPLRLEDGQTGGVDAESSYAADFEGSSVVLAEAAPLSFGEEPLLSPAPTAHEKEEEEEAYEEVFEPESSVVLPLAQPSVAEYAADFDTGSSLLLPAEPSVDEYGADYEEPSAVLLPVEPSVEEEYGADFDLGSSILLPAQPSTDTYGADFEEDTSRQQPTRSGDNKATASVVREIASEKGAAAGLVHADSAQSVTTSARRTQSMNCLSEDRGDESSCVAVAQAEEDAYEDSYQIMDGDELSVRRSFNSGKISGIADNGPAHPTGIQQQQQQSVAAVVAAPRSIIEQVQAEFDDFDAEDGEDAEILDEDC